jgi:hypothetical protein
MKRTPLKREKHLRRETPLRARRAKADGPRRSERVRDVDYMLLVKTMPCCARGIAGHVCSGRVEADHAGLRPTGRKADDRTVIPLCQQGHLERTNFSGPFRSWDRARMRAWLDEQIAKTQRFRELIEKRQADRRQQAI